MTLDTSGISGVALTLAVVVTAAFQSSTGAQAPVPRYKNATLAVEARVSDLLGRMTVDEKIGQMTQADSGSVKPEEVQTLFLGSVLSGGDSEPPDVSPAGWAAMVEGYQKRALATRLAIPILYGIDAVHGHSNVRGAVVFPHNIGLGCTRNPKLVQEIGRITALEVAATGIHWNFAPCIAVPQDDRWGRTYEGFGETAELAVLLGPAAVVGMQGERLSASSLVLATPKHFLADGGTKGGIDRGDAVVDEGTLRKLHLPGYEATLKAGAGSVMVSFSSWNGEKMHGNRRLVTGLLKEELGFDGLVVSDWNAIDELPHDYVRNVADAVNAGIDMVMAPDTYLKFIDALKQNVQSGKVPMSRIDDAVGRILTTKFRMGLFERPFRDPALLAKVGAPEHRVVARRAVRESQVLLVNNKNALPLSKGLSHVVVGGKAANDIGLQAGGWTISWQGSRGAVTDGTTVLQAVQKALPKAKVTHAPTGDVPEGAQAAIIVIGEEPYAEMKGDRTELTLDPEDVQAVRNASRGDVPVVVVLFSGRPLILEPILDEVDALIAAWLPGSEGDGIADVLFGDYNPTGKLSVTWPRSMDQQPINVGVTGGKPAGALFDYGFGLSYGTSRR